MARNPAPIHHPFQRPRAPLKKGGGFSRRWQIAAVVVAAILALAWFDGGEEPIRPITQDVTLPEAQ